MLVYQRVNPQNPPVFGCFLGVLGRLNLDTGKMMDHVKFETGNMVGLAINDGGNWTKAYKNPFTQHILIYIYIIIVYDWYTWYDYNNYVLGFHSI